MISPPPLPPKKRVLTGPQAFTGGRWGWGAWGREVVVMQFYREPQHCWRTALHVVPPAIPGEAATPAPPQGAAVSGLLGCWALLSFMMSLVYLKKAIFSSDLARFSWGSWLFYCLPCWTQIFVDEYSKSFQPPGVSENCLAITELLEPCHDSTRTRGFDSSGTMSTFQSRSG